MENIARDPLGGASAHGCHDFARPQKHHRRPNHFLQRDGDAELLNERELAALFRVSVRTLQNWRVTGGGPEFIKLGARVLYSRERITAYLEDRQRVSTSDDGSEVTREKGGDRS